MPVTLKQKMINELNCPSCFNLMYPPLMQCSTGHQYCNDCIESYERCPVCDAPMGTVRNHRVERLCFGAILKCSYSVHGCPFRGTCVVVADHETDCFFSMRAGAENKDHKELVLDDSSDQHDDLSNQQDDPSNQQSCVAVADHKTDCLFSMGTHEENNDNKEMGLDEPSNQQLDSDDDPEIVENEQLELEIDSSSGYGSFGDAN